MRRPLFSICTEHKTSAGVATSIIKRDGVGLCLHATTPDEAIAKARRLMPWLPTNITAIPEAN